MQACARCNQQGKFRCTGCSSVYYCSPICQKDHWIRGHKGQCKTLKAASGPSMSLKKSGDGIEVSAIAVPNVAKDLYLCKPERVAVLAEYDRNSLPFGGCGIENLGNTCFVNSVLQVLASCAPLVLYLQAREHALNCKNKTGFCSLCAMTEWTELVSKTTSEYVLRPIKILRNLSVFGEFHLGVQSDAAEFFYGIMESLQKALIGDCPSRPSLEQEETTLLRQLTGGFKAHQLVCRSCKWISPLKSFEYFLDLPCPPANGKMSVEEMLEAFFQPQLVEGWKCPQCLKDTGATENTFLYRVHSCLSLTLMRFDHSGRKLHFPIAFRDQLNLRQFVPTQVIFSLFFFFFFFFFCHLFLLKC